MKLAARHAKQNPTLTRLVAIGLSICLSIGSAHANQSEPEEVFFSYLEEHPDVDVARNYLMQEYGFAVGSEIAIYLCMPAADPRCEGSAVYAAWMTFLDMIAQDIEVDTARIGIQNQFEDSYLAIGIASAWCSPEPGEGCGDDPFTSAWQYFYERAEHENPAHIIEEIGSQVDPTLAELIAARACGEDTCYRDDIDNYSDEIFENAQVPEVASGQPQSEKEQSQTAKADQFFQRAKRPPTTTRQRICKILPFTCP